MTNSKSEIAHKPLPKNDPERRRPNISLAKEKLDWEPTVDLEDGLAKTIEYFDSLDLDRGSEQSFGLAKTMSNTKVK